jgi:uncharacterized membrane protein YdjX (TVP38/TMEM64 family)
MIIGWTLGAQIAFYLGRYAMDKVHAWFPNMYKHNYIEKLIDENHVYFSIIFLRMAMPVDILSYALGLFTPKITAKDNLITTLIGITPFAFVFAYASEMKNLSVMLLGVSLVLLVLYIFYVRKMRKTA